MKTKLSWDEIENWRDRVHRKGNRGNLKNTKNAVGFVNSVGFCLVFKSEGTELPCLLHAVIGRREEVVPNPYAHLTHAPEIRKVLEASPGIYFGRVFNRRPSLISRGFLPYFYVLAGRSGSKDEHVTEFMRGKISPTEKAIMDELVGRPLQPTKELKRRIDSTLHHSNYEKALDKLQQKMFIVRWFDAERVGGFAWSPVRKCYPVEIRKARKITDQIARREILKRHFQNQLVLTVDDIFRVFRWPKQEIYRTLGGLVQQGLVTTNVKVKSSGSPYYCLVH